MSGPSEHQAAEGLAATARQGGAAGLPPQDGAAQRLERRQWRQLVVISVAAVAIYVTLRLLPTGTNLNHMDFRVQGNNSIEFCDPLNPQFIPVVAARSPVTLTVKTAAAPVAGGAVQGVLALRTAAGKPIAPPDLLVVHEHPLHLMIIDPSLTDYQHVHPQPGASPGEWTFSFQPRFGGNYRLFADFTPVATARGLYANADLKVEGPVAKRGDASKPAATRDLGPAAAEQGGYRFALKPSKLPLRVREPIDFTFEIVSLSGGRVPMQTIMGAYAHLVAFDDTRSGFAHLHPAQVDPLQPPDPVKPVLQFKLTIPAAGRYVIWAQVNLAGQEVFVPFWFSVAE